MVCTNGQELIIWQHFEPAAGPCTPQQQAILAYHTQHASTIWPLPVDFSEHAYVYSAVSPSRQQLVALLYAAGAPLLLGTDAPRLYATPGPAVHQELQDLVDAGLTPYAALRTATYNAALFLRRLDTSGTVEVGKQADLVLLNANPLADIANTRQIEGVLIQGQWLPKAVLEALISPE